MKYGIVLITIAFMFLFQTLIKIWKRRSVLEVKKGKLLYTDKETINLTKGIFIKLMETKK